MLGSSWVAELLAASQEGLNPTELIVIIIAIIIINMVYLTTLSITHTEWRRMVGWLMN
jgi:hypothetical protein